jgi:hypothetical protein
MTLSTALARTPRRLLTELLDDPDLVSDVQGLASTLRQRARFESRGSPAPSTCARCSATPARSSVRSGDSPKVEGRGSSRP